MNQFTKIALIGIAIYSAYRLGQLKRIKTDLIEDEKEIVKKGSFSKEIEKLQKNINGIYGFEKLPITGAFCKKTKFELDHVFKENVFYNKIDGSIEIESLKEVNKVLNALNNNINA